MFLKTSIKIIAILVLAVILVCCTSEEIAEELDSSSSSDVSSSSVVLPSSSSSLIASSSSGVMSSSSLALSSSSVALSSSSSSEAEPSSSSLAPSSSSLVPSSSSSSDDGSFTDARDGQTYNTVKIGTQTWMAKNLNYDESGSLCYNNDPANCEIYGRLYDWVTAMDLPESCFSEFCASQINAKHRGVCPEGWHILNAEDWNILMNYVQTDNNGNTYTSGSSTASIAGKYLKTASGWNDYNGQSGNGEDKYGFAALPGGYGSYSDDSFYSIGNYGYWWSSGEDKSSYYYAYFRSMNYSSEAYWYDVSKRRQNSVRCVQD